MALIEWFLQLTRSVFSGLFYGELTCYLYLYLLQAEYLNVIHINSSL
jgi:hypothetical protein